MTDTKLHKVGEAAALAQVSPSSIYRWIRQGKIDVIRDGLVYVYLDQVTAQRKRTSRRTSTIPSTPPTGLITIKQAAAQTGISTRTIQGWAKAGTITAIRYRQKLWYVSLDDCLDMRSTAV